MFLLDSIFRCYEWATFLGGGGIRVDVGILWTIYFLYETYRSEWNLGQMDWCSMTWCRHVLEQPMRIYIFILNSKFVHCISSNDILSNSLTAHVELIWMLQERCTSLIVRQSTVWSCVRCSFPDKFPIHTFLSRLMVVGDN